MTFICILPQGEAGSMASTTEEKTPPASWVRWMASRAWRSDRANLSSLATTIPPVAPSSTRLSARMSSGRFFFAPDSSRSVCHSAISTSRSLAHRSICSRCLAGLMNDAPSLPRTCETRMYPSSRTRRLGPEHHAAVRARRSLSRRRGFQRAGVMGAAGLMALGASRPGSRWYALLLAATATLALNPRVLADPGWQLSFAAVIAILGLGRPLRSALEGLPGPLAEGIAITVAATIGTAPLLAHHFGTVSLSGLPANVAAMPAVAATMWLGMLAAAVGQLAAAPVLDPLALALATLLGRLNGLCLAFVEAVAERFAAAPGAAVELPLAHPGAVAGAYAAIAAVAVLALRGAPRVEPWVTSARAAFRRLPAARRRPLMALGAALVALASMAALAPPGPPSEPTVSFLDVGQGDATLVQSPEGGAVLFDGGPPEAGVARLLRRRGVRHLSAVVATHQSRDHQGGLAEVLERIPTDLYVDGGDGNTDPRLLAIARTAARRGVPRAVPRPGDVVRVPGLSIRVLGPPPRPPGPAPEDANPRALVTVVSSHGFDVFLSGDAESASLVPLPLPDVDAMKVSHHGSRDPGLPVVLGRLRPQVAGIEVGEGNGYGHLAPQTLAALHAARVRVLRTDRDGTSAVSAAEGGLAIDTEK